MSGRPDRLVALLVSAGILLAGNGLLVTLVAVRANLEGFPEATIGLMGTSYFIGFFAGCLATAGLIRRAGHIRVFASLASLAAICALLLVLLVDPWIWIAIRVVMGFCFSGFAMVIESWLNEAAANRDRGRVLSLYRIVDLCAVTGAQFLLPAIGAMTFAVFAVTAIFFCFALIPISLSSSSSPTPPASAKLHPTMLWRLSPVAAIGCITIGLTNGAFRTVGPLYGQAVGLTVDQVALFMSLGIFAGALFQYPLGWLSDRLDRRVVLLLATGGAALASLFLSGFGSQGIEAIYAGAFFFGGFALPLYSLSAAHANDHANPGQFVELAAGLTLFYALGASIGPLVASLVIERFGAPAFFVYTCSLHAGFVVFVLYRMTRRAAVPRPRRKGFVGLLRTSPAFFRLSRVNGEGPGAKEVSPRAQAREGG
jgi:MFS family permease